MPSSSEGTCSLPEVLPVAELRGQAGLRLPEAANPMYYLL